MKWDLHHAVQPFEEGIKNGVFMSDLSDWRKTNPVTGYNDWYQEEWDYARRFNLYNAVYNQEGIDAQPIDYIEFGVAGGHSLKWWIEKNKHQDTRFYGFDTFEGLPEKWGGFEKGAMAVDMAALNITDGRVELHKGLFQDTLLPFLENFKNEKRKLIHLDADLFSATLFVLTQLYRFLKPGDVLLFDEFAVPQHEFLAFKLFSESFYLKYEVIGAANNYLFVAIKIK